MPERDIRRSRTVALFSSAVSDGSLSSMPSAPIGWERSISPRSTAIPIRALSRLLRTEASGVLADVSPHSATTAPRCTTITAVEPMRCDHCSAFASLLADHPAASGSTRSQAAPGKRSAAAANSSCEQQAKNGCDQSKRAKLHPRPSTVLRARACQFESRRASGRNLGQARTIP